MSTHPSAQQQIIQEVIRIADNLIATASEDENGSYWKTPAPDNNSAPGESTDLFNGSTGIILFLLTLYEYNKEQRFLTAALRAANRLLQHPAVNEPAYFTFYTGTTSVLLLCITLHRITGDDQYLEKANILTAIYEPGILSKVDQDDLLSGNAGNLLLFTHMYAYTGETCYRKIASRLIDTLIAKARITSEGLKWDPVKHAYDSLTGFSHGVAGIAFACIQAAKCFNSDGLRYLAEQALAYEMKYYDDERHNWMDLRVGVQRLANIQQQQGMQLARWELNAFYPTMSDVNTWAHGAAGSGLSRLYAWEMTGNEDYLRQAMMAITRGREDIANSERGDFTLCSGYGGVAALLQEAARLLHQPEMQKETQTIARKAIQYYHDYQTYNSYIQTDPQDPGLFSGLAGVGYFLLGTVAPHGNHCILHPTITTPRPHPEMNGYTVDEVKKRIFLNYYPKTLPILLQQQRIQLNEITALTHIHQLSEKLQEVIDTCPAASNISNLLHADQQTIALWLQHKGWLQHRKRQELQLLAQQHLITDSTTAFLTQLLTISPHVKWYANEADAAFPFTIIYSHETGINSLQAGKLTCWLLNILQTPMSTQSLLDILSTQTNNSTEQLMPLICSQLKELLQSGLLTTPA